MKGNTCAALALGILMLGCSDDGDGGESTKRASAEIEARSGNTTLSGTASFTEVRGEAVITLEVEGAPPGEHGAHIHEIGDCSAADAMSAGEHWNPDDHAHGDPGATSHLGDLGNLSVDADGTGRLTLRSETWTVGDGGDHDVVGKAIVIHANEDDLTSQPSGNSGGRIGCGVIE
jgi:superoxide dismutase, Cu-Zn family